MFKSTTTILSLTLTLAFAACDDDDPVIGVDAAAPAPDAGANTGHDLGAPDVTPPVDAMTTVDSGPMPGSDAGAPDMQAAAMPRGPAGKPALGAQIDRTGRPAISTALIETFSADDAAKGAKKDEYNRSTPAQGAGFVPNMKASLAIMDALDGTCGNQLLAAATGDRYAMLATVLGDDQLYVNSTSGTCGVYLGAEAEVVGAVPAGMGGCGGRTPLDDVIARSYSVLAAGALAGVDDTITSDGAPHDPNTFPFLAPPNP